VSCNSKLRARVGAHVFRIFKNEARVFKVLVLPKRWSQAFFVQVLDHSAFINAFYRSFALKLYTKALHNRLP